MDPVAAKVIQEISSISCVPGVNLTDELVDDLGLEPVDMIEIALFIEQEFGADVSDEKLFWFRTVADVVSYVRG
jgi:acyl carrier protein